MSKTDKKEEAKKNPNVEKDVEATKAMEKELSKPGAIFHKTVDRGDHLYTEFWMERKKTGVDLIVYTCYKKDFLAKLGKPTLDGVNFVKEWLLNVAKDGKQPEYFHNSTGPAYGAAYKDPKTGEIEYAHREFWINAKRITDEGEIKRLIFDQAFSNKAADFISGGDGETVKASNQ